MGKFGDFEPDLFGDQKQPQETTKPKPSAQPDKKTTPVQALPTWKDDVAAAVHNATAGLSNLLPEGVAKAGTAMAERVGSGALAKGALKLIPGVGWVDTGMVVAGVAAPLIRRELGDAAGDLAQSAGEHAPSQMLADKVSSLFGDASKGSTEAGAVGVLAGMNPTNMAKSLIQNDLKGASNALGKNTAGALGATYGNEAVGGVAASAANSIAEKTTGKPLTPEERESVKNLTAPLSAHGAGKLYDKVGQGSLSAANAIKAETARPRAEERVKAVESELPPEATVDVHRVAKNLVKQGLSENEALSVVKKTQQGVYGGLDKRYTQDVDHKVVDSIKSTIEDSLGGTNAKPSKQAIDTVNTAVRSIDTVKSLTDAAREAQEAQSVTKEDLASKLKQRAALDSDVNTTRQQLEAATPSYDTVKDTPAFKKWLGGRESTDEQGATSINGGHDVTNLPEGDKKGLAAKFFINKAIDNYYEKHVNPIRDELMNSPSGIISPEDFADHVANEVQKHADFGGSKNLYQSTHNEVLSRYENGQLDTMGGVYDIFNAMENSGQFADNPGAKGKIKDAIASYFPEDVQKQISDFKAAYRPYGEAFAKDTPLYKMSAYDPTSGSNGAALSNWLEQHGKAGKSEEGFNSVLDLAKESPDVGYSVIHGINNKIGQAIADKGIAGAAQVIRDHIVRANALADVLPDGHPVKNALYGMQGMLEIAKKSAVLDDAIKESKSNFEKAVKSGNIDTSAMDDYVNKLQHYGRFATDSYVSLLGTLAKDPGMLAALKNQPIGSAVPLTHDIAKSLMEASPNADITKQQALLKALSSVQDTSTVIPDLIRHGISGEIAAFRQDGSLDHLKTADNMKRSAPKVTQYIANLQALLDSTPGLKPEEVKASKQYLNNVSDAIDVASSDLVTKLLDRVYSPAEAMSTKGVIKEGSGGDIKKLGYSAMRGSSHLWMGLSAANDVIHNFINGKDATTVAILKRLDDPAFVKEVSGLKDGYSKQKEADIRAEADARFKGVKPSVDSGLIKKLQDWMPKAMPSLIPQQGYLKAARDLAVWYGNAVRDTRSFQAEKHRERQKFEQDKGLDQQNDQPYAPDETMQRIMNWKG